MSTSYNQLTQLADQVPQKGVNKLCAAACGFDKAAFEDSLKWFIS
jgi:hypothetical protein